MPLARITQVLKDRQKKPAMADASYWDERARSRSGFARSVWHSESFSMAWDERQQALLRDTLESLFERVEGLAVADVGCGTGRITRFLARSGAKATGFDFSPATVEAAQAETRAAGLTADFVVADATTGALPVADGTFDASLAIGCLAVACRDLDALERALSAMAHATKHGGAVVLLEPVHTSRFLGRVLRASVDDWISAGERTGLRLVSQRGMGFLPARLAFSSLDLPGWLVGPTFTACETALDAIPALEPASDYRLIVFRKP